MNAGTQRIGRAIVTHPASVAALVWVVGVVIIGLAIAVPIFSPYTPTGQNLSMALALPSAEHWLGTDGLGRDILTRLGWGAHVTLTGLLIAAVVAIGLGSVMGVISGHFRGAVDVVFTGFADMLMSIPTLVFLLSVSAVTSRNFTIVMIVLGVMLSAGTYRVFRAATLNIRGELYITAARTSGLREGQIIGRHEIPRLLGQLIVQATVVASLALVVQVSLGFIGVDTVPPTPSWGNMIRDASLAIYTGVWSLIPPAVVVAVTVLAFSAIGDAAQRATLGGMRDNGLRRQRVLKNNNSVKAAVTATAPVDADEYVLDVDDLSILIEANGKQIPLVSNVSLRLAAGEIVGLVGESGAGKSVTARATLGIFPSGATATGSVRVRGEQVLGRSEQNLQKLRGTTISYISQEPMAALNPAYTIGTQLIEAIRTHTKLGRRAARERALELLESVQIKDPQAVLRAYPHQISGGMAQRVMITIALSGDPDVLVADEPTTALDVSVQMQILDLLRALQKERNLAVLLVTHDWGVVADICDRGVAMYAGEVVEEAEAEELFANPRHPYSIALRAADPHAQSRGDKLNSIPGQVPPPGSWPTGCRFAARCQFAEPACTEGPVPLLTVGESHTARCIRVEAVSQAVAAAGGQPGHETAHNVGAEEASAETAVQNGSVHGRRVDGRLLANDERSKDSNEIDAVKGFTQ